MKSKNILITGSSRGIGAAIARLAHKQGYVVILNGKRESEKLDEIHRDLDGSHKLVFDISDKVQTYSAIRGWINKNGNIHYVVNNAGIARNFLKDISEMDDDLAIEEYKTNVLGTLHVVQSVIDEMKKDKKGSIVNIASIKGHSQLSTLSTLTYAPTKAGIISITTSLAKAYAEYGIRVNSVSPGYIETDQVKDWNQDTFERINNGTLAGRIGQPDEIAELVMFLISDKASYINGEDILADGGYKLKGK